MRPIPSASAMSVTVAPGGECLGDSGQAAFAAEFRGGFGLCFFGDWCLVVCSRVPIGATRSVMRSISA